MESTTTIYDLPEALLLHILSFIPTQDAIRASFVSRSFRNLWHSIPSLNFDMLKFNSHYGYKSKRLFMKFVSRTIALRPRYALEKFVVTFGDWYIRGDEKTHVQDWIQYALSSSVSELELRFGLYYFGYFDLNLSDIGETCIKVLKLYSCNLKFPSKTNPIKFLSLKSLELYGGKGLDRNDLCNLLARCVNLETLKLLVVQFDTAGELRIYSATIKELYIKGCCCKPYDSQVDLDICCPNLQKICFTAMANLGNYIISDTTLVEEWMDLEGNGPSPSENRWEEILSHFSNISSLSVWNKFLESYEVPGGCKQYASNVKHLEISCSYIRTDLVALAALLKLLPNLEILGLHNRFKWDEEFVTQDHRCDSPILVMPRLRKVILRDYSRVEDEHHFIKLFEKNGVVLDKIKLQ